jgi:hypothetical protein
MKPVESETKETITLSQLDSNQTVMSNISSSKSVGVANSSEKSISTMDFFIFLDFDVLNFGFW